MQETKNFCLFLMALFLISGCHTSFRPSKQPGFLHGQKPTFLLPEFKQGAHQAYEGSLDLKLQMSVLGGRKRRPMIIKSRFELHREISSVDGKKVTFLDTFHKVRFLDKKGSPKPFTALSKEMEGVKIRWSVNRSGRDLLEFEAPDQGPLIKKLGLLRTLKRMYELSSAAPQKKVAPGDTWKRSCSVKTSFSGLPLKLHITVVYRYRKKAPRKKGFFYRITGKEIARVPEVKETNTKHNFKIGGFVQGKVEILLAPSAPLWKSWSVKRAFAIAASKISASGKEVTFGIRYDVAFGLWPLKKR